MEVMEARLRGWYFWQEFAESHDLALRWPKAATLLAAVLFPAEQNLKGQTMSVVVKRQLGEEQDVEKQIQSGQSIQF